MTPEFEMFETEEPDEQVQRYLEICGREKKTAYQSLTLAEKIEFFDGIHTERIPLFDEDGDDTLWTLWNYGEIFKEFVQKPEVFSIPDILRFLQMLDDDCFELSFMDETLKVIRSIVRCYGKDGALYLLSHLADVPEQGKGYGLYYCLKYLVHDETTFPYLMEAAPFLDDSARDLLLRILHGQEPGVISPMRDSEETFRERFSELERAVQRKEPVG